MYLRKLANSRREAPGLERGMLRKLPVILLGGTLIPHFFQRSQSTLPARTGCHSNCQTPEDRGHPVYRNSLNRMDGCIYRCHRLLRGGTDEGAVVCC